MNEVCRIPLYPSQHCDGSLATQEIAGCHSVHLVVMVPLSILQLLISSFWSLQKLRIRGVSAEACESGRRMSSRHRSCLLQLLQTLQRFQMSSNSHMLVSQLDSACSHPHGTYGVAQGKRLHSQHCVLKLTGMRTMQQRVNARTGHSFISGNAFVGSTYRGD